MNTENLGLYKVWAPDDAEWTAWAKPVLFASLHFSWGSPLDTPQVPARRDAGTMIIIDLPGKRGVEEALAYAKTGYRPVPLYNGVLGVRKLAGYGYPTNLTRLAELGEALCTGAGMLASLPLPPDAPPVFMLDSGRMKGTALPGEYDNRWCVFPQDMPSAAYLKSRGISKIIVRMEQKLQSDLERVLHDYQKNGIALFALRNDDASPQSLTANKQSWMKEWAYRFGVMAGLRRNATGGFGGIVPEASSGGGYG